MRKQLFIFIGDSDEQNGDYWYIHELASNGDTAYWSCLKTSRRGDRVLIYIQKPHSALIAQAEVLSEPDKGEPGDYAYRADIGNFKLLPNRVDITDLKREFPEWAWLRYPRHCARVPESIAPRLWSLVHEKQSNVQILMFNADSGLALLKELSSSGRSRFLSVPKLTKPGDTVLFYVSKPVSAIIAKGEAMSMPRVTELKWYEAKVGKISMLDSPIKLIELRSMFPRWTWLRSVNMFAYVSQERAKELLERVSLKEIETVKIEKDISSRHGGGFGDPVKNRVVEKAAILKVRRHMKDLGYRVLSRERDKVGYDLDCQRGRTELHIEVKGVSGTEIRFILTARERQKMESDANFVLTVVTSANNRESQIHNFSGRGAIGKFDFRPLAFMTTLRIGK